MPNFVKGRVKGSKQKRMKVVPHRPARKIVLSVIIALFLVGGPIVGYQLGHRNGNFQGNIAQLEWQRLALELEDVLQENAALRSEVALLDRSNVMDQRTSDEVQQTILSLRDQIARLEQDVLFYRQVMTADLADVGLVVGEIDIEATDESNRFSYNLVMRQQDSDGRTYLTGYVQVGIIGTQNESTLEIPLHQISEDESEKDIKLRFRNFQNIDGMLELPTDFTPVQIHITAIQTAPVAKSIEHRFDWQVGGD